MTKHQYQQLIIRSIDQTLQNNYDRISLSLLADVKETDDLMTMETKMLRNAIAVSCQISLQLVGDMLEQAEVVHFDEEPVPAEKPNLRIVPNPASDSASSQNPSDDPTDPASDH